VFILGDLSSSPQSSIMFDVVSNLHFLSKFIESDPDTFFSVSECVSDVGLTWAV